MDPEEVLAECLANIRGIPWPDYFSTMFSNTSYRTMRDGTLRQSATIRLGIDSYAVQLLFTLITYLIIAIRSAMQMQ